MPVEVTVDAATGVITVVARGEITLEDLRASFLDTLAHPDFQPGMDVLLDLTEGGAGGLRPADLREHLNAIDRHRAQRGVNYRVAVVAPRDVDFGVFRMYGSLADEQAFAVMVFRTRAEAEAWLTPA